MLATSASTWAIGSSCCSPLTASPPAAPRAATRRHATTAASIPWRCPRRRRGAGRFPKRGCSAATAPRGAGGRTGRGPNQRVPNLWIQPGRLGQVDGGRHPCDHRVVVGQEATDPLPAFARADGQRLQLRDGVQHPPVAHLRAGDRDVGQDGVDTARPAQQGPHLRRSSALPDRGDAERDAEQVQGLQQAQPHGGRHGDVRRQESGEGAVERGGRTGVRGQRLQRRPHRGVRVVERGDREQGGHRHHRRAQHGGKLRAARPRRRDRPVPAGKGPGQVRFVQHRQHRAPSGGDRVDVFRLDHLGGHIHDDVDIPTVGAQHRDPGADSGAVQRPGHRVTTHAAASSNQHAQRRGGALGDGRHARVSVAGRESRQLVDENLVSLSPHALPVRFDGSDRSAAVATTACGASPRPASFAGGRSVPPNGGTCVTLMRATV